MTVQNQTMRWGPEITPTAIRNLIVLTAGISLCSALSEPLLKTLYGLPGLSYLLSLSWQGMQHYFLWQIVTFLFVENSEGYGISFSFLIGLAFNMYIVWIMGTDLLGRIGEAAFWRFYLLSGVLAGLAGLAAMNLTGLYGVLSGPTPAVLAVLTAWTLFNPEVELLFFFLIPVKAKWLWAALAGALILVSLSHLDWISLAFYGTALLFGYIYAVMAWQLAGPFAWTHRFDTLCSTLGEKLQSIRLKSDSKIIDFKTGEPLLDDNRFVDAMLEKISKHGEASLTWKERQRLQSISKSKRN